MTDTEVREIIDNTHQQILDTEEVVSEMAETNAFDWSIGDYEVTDIDHHESSSTATITFTARGEQDEDSGSCGNTITGEATATINSNGGVTYECISADVEDWG